MQRDPFRRAVPWVAAGAVLAAGLAWRDCVLTASSGLLALHAFYGHMDGHAPWQGWRAALRCWLMGVAGLMAALALVGMVSGVVLGWWAQANDRPVAALATLCAAVGVSWLARRDLPRRGRDHAVALAMLLLAAVALRTHDLGFALAPCLFALTSSALLMVAGWRLAHDTARALVYAESRVWGAHRRPSPPSPSFHHPPAICVHAPDGWQSAGTDTPGRGGTTEAMTTDLMMVKRLRLSLKWERCSSPAPSRRPGAATPSPHGFAG